MGSRQILQIRRQVLEGILYKFGDYFIEDWTDCLQTGIGIDLDEPDVVVNIYHEV